MPLTFAFKKKGSRWLMQKKTTYINPHPRTLCYRTLFFEGWKRAGKANLINKMKMESTRVWIMTGGAHRIRIIWKWRRTHRLRRAKPPRCTSSGWPTRGLEPNSCLQRSDEDQDDHRDKSILLFRWELWIIHSFGPLAAPNETLAYLNTAFTQTTQHMHNGGITK